MLKIDDDFVDRYLASLPQQQVGVDDDGEIIPLTKHWIGQMLDQLFEEPNSSCERFSRFIKANLHLFQEYVKRSADQTPMAPEMQATFLLELVAIFSFKVLERAHEEAIERLREGGEDFLEED